MQVLAFNSRVIHRDCPTVHTKIKHQLKEAVRLVIMRGLAAGESRRRPKLMFFRGGRQRGQLEMVHTWCVVVSRTRPLLLLVFGGHSRLCPCSRRVSRRLDICCFSHLRKMFCIPFAELLHLMRQELGILHGRIPNVESILRCCGREDPAA